MNEDVLASRQRISRRRALSMGGTLTLSGVLAACGSGGSATKTGASASTSASAFPKVSISPSQGPAAGADVLALLDKAGTCTMAVQETQGPYWFDVDAIRSDLREDRPGTRLDLAVRVQDLTGCSTGGSATAVQNCVVEIWHCDAGGIYSGFESGSLGANGGGGGAGGPGGGTPPSGAPGGGPGGAPPSGAPGGGGPGGAPPSGGPGGGGPEGGGTPPSGAPGAGGLPGGAGGGSAGGGTSGGTSDGSYSVGDAESAKTDDDTYLRGAQMADSNGVVQFVTIWPGWYTGRTVHIHLKVHIDKKTVMTTQLFFDEALNSEVFATSPYSDHTGRDTLNSADTIYNAAGLLSVSKHDSGYQAVINVGIDV